MKPIGFIALVGILSFNAFAEQQVDLAAKLKTDWKWVQVYYTGTGPTGTSYTPESIFISRDAGKIIIYRVATDPAYESDTYSRGRILSSAEYDSIIKDLLMHYGQACREMSLVEYFNSLPEDQRNKELEDYYSKYGRPIEGFPQHEIVIRFSPGGDKDRITKGFSEKTFSFSDFCHWIRSIQGG